MAVTPPPARVSDRGSAPAGWRRSYLLVLTGALGLYLLSMSPGASWQDSGLAQVRTLRGDLYGDLGLALSHPLYYLLTMAAQALPFAESAFKTNLVSALAGAVTVANVFLVLYLATGRRRGALIGAVSLAVAHTFWQHCALAEVYTVSTALLSGELICLALYTRTGRVRWLVVLFLLNGLGISNHMLACLSVVCYAAMVLWLLVRGSLRRRIVPVLALAWLAGAGLYAGLIIGRICSGAGFHETLRSALVGQSYARYVFNPFPSVACLRNSGLYLGMNFPTPTVLLVLPGLVRLLRERQRLLHPVLAALLAVHLAWAVRYDVPDQYTFFIPSIVLLSCAIGLGADRFLEARSRRWVFALLSGAALPVIVYVPLPAVARALNVDIGVARQIPYREQYAYFLHPWKTGYRGPERFAAEVRDALPGGAVLFAETTAVRPIHYLQLTGGWREDVRVCPPIATEDWDVPECHESALARQLAAGLVYVASDRPGYCPAWILDGYVLSREELVHRVSKAKRESRR